MATVPGCPTTARSLQYRVLARPVNALLADKTYHHVELAKCRREFMKGSRAVAKY